MTRHPKAITTAAVAVILVLGAVGCANDEPPPAPSTTTSAAPTSTTPPTTQDEEADEARAEEALLTAEEVPGGPWIEGDARTRSGGTGLDCDDMREESDYFNEHAKGAPGAKAPEFEDESGEQAVQLDVNIVATDEIAENVAAAFADDRFAGCLEQRLTDEASSGSATVSDVVVEVLDVEDVGDSAVAWTVSFTVEQGSRTAEVGGVVAFVQVGRGFANVSLLSSSPVEASDIEPIMVAAADKLEAALAS